MVLWEVFEYCFFFTVWVLGGECFCCWLVSQWCGAQIIWITHEVDEQVEGDPFQSRSSVATQLFLFTLSFCERKAGWKWMGGAGLWKIRHSPVWLTFPPLTLRKKRLFPTVWQNNSVVLVAPVSAWIRGRVLQIYKGAPESCLSMCTTNVHLITVARRGVDGWMANEEWDILHILEGGGGVGGALQE